jgi:phosphatidylglycerol:prolipoprotein diacylglycerol transferase
MIGLAGVLVATSLIGAHLLDVIAYQLDDASHDWTLWLHVDRGISVFGAFAAIAITTVVWSSAGRLPLGRVADCVVLGVVVALAIGRIGCAYVHDHPGVPTDLPIGIERPAELLRWAGLDATGSVRVHDLGLDELLGLVPIAGLLWALAGRLRPGMIAIGFALAYAPLRFMLDFLRLPRTEPSHAGLTTGQWGSIVLAAMGLAALIVTLARPPTLDPPNTRP